MQPQEVKDIIAQVLAEQRREHNHSFSDDIILKTIATILTSFGIDEEDRQEIKADFAHLRRWRKSVEQAQTYGLKAVVTVIATGLLGAVWLGVKTMLGK